MKDTLADLTVDAFRTRLGNRFRIRLDPENAIETELIEARPLGDSRVSQKGSAPRRTPFALLFRTSSMASLPQRIYCVEHDEMGAYDIFLVPVGPDGVGMVYEAIFT